MTFSIPSPEYLLNYGPTVDIDITASSTSLTDVPIEGKTGFSYSSSNSGVAEIDADSSVVTPDGPGPATITASLLIPGSIAFTATTDSEGGNHRHHS